MAHYNHFNLGFNITPTPASGTTVGIQQSHVMLAQVGFNLMVEISTASAFLNVGNPIPRKTIAVMAHLDTGASLTSIDHSVAQHLGLITIGQQRIGTASGLSIVNNYAIDLAFLGTTLRGVQNMQITSCQLPHFNLQETLLNPNVAKNFGMLIGRDLMARWSITWHGPTSTVLLSD